MRTKTEYDSAKSPPNAEELRKMRRKSILKMGIMAVLALIIWIFSSMHMQIKQMTAETA